MTTIMVTVAKRYPSQIVYDSQVSEHLRSIDRKYHSLIRTTIEQQLTFNANVPTRNRKRLSQPAVGAEWELRFGPDNRFRVFYALDDAARQVQILAIGVKEGSRLTIGGEEIEI